MSVVVTVLSVQPGSDWAGGLLRSGTVTVSVTGDYRCQTSLQAQIVINFSDQPSQEQAIRDCLGRLADTAQQFLTGALKAAQEVVPGG